MKEPADDEELAEMLEQFAPPELRPLITELAEASLTVMKLATGLALAAYHAGRRSNAPKSEPRSNAHPS